MLNKIFFLFYSLTRSNLLSLLINRLYLPVYFQYEWIKSYNIKTIIDVGGNKGHVTKALSYIFPQALIYVFEPIPAEYSALTKNLASNKIIINQFAVSDRCEEVEFFVLKGGLNTIKRNRPILFLEMLRKWSTPFNYHPNDIINLLTNVGYQCYIIDGKKLKKFSKITEKTTNTNFIFMHKNSLLLRYNK